MRLQRLKTRTIGPKDYHKWVLNPPGEIIEALGWKPGDQIEAKAKGDSMILRKTN